MKVITIHAEIDTEHPAYIEPRNWHEVLDMLSRFVVAKDTLWSIQDVVVARDRSAK